MLDIQEANKNTTSVYLAVLKASDINWSLIIYLFL